MIENDKCYFYGSEDMQGGFYAYAEQRVPGKYRSGGPIMLETCKKYFQSLSLLIAAKGSSARKVQQERKTRADIAEDKWRMLT